MMGIELDLQSMQSAIVSEAAERLVDTTDLRRSFKEEVTRRIDKFFAEEAEVQLQSAIAAAVEDGFSRTYQPVDTFGKPVGEPSTIRDRLSKMTSDYWSARVDKNGRRTESSYSSMSRAEYVMLQACGEDFAKELKQRAVDVTGRLKDGLRAELREWVDKTLSDLFHVKSADDQAAGKRR